MKKVLLIIICFVTFFTFSVGFTREPYNVSASTVVDYNLFDFDPSSLGYLSNAEVSFLDKGFIISTKEVSGYVTSARFRYTLMPNAEYILTYSVEKLVEGSHNRVIARNSNSTVLKSTVEGNSVTFITDSTGTGVFEFFAFWEWEGSIDKKYKTKYYDVRLRFVDENLGAAYISGYNNGLSKRDVREWLPFTDITFHDDYNHNNYGAIFRPDNRYGRYLTMPMINNVNPFGYTEMYLPAGTYRLSFVGEYSSSQDYRYYPLMHDFDGMIFLSTTYGFETAICVSDHSKRRPDMLDIDIFNLDNSPYTVEDAFAYKPIVFTILPSLLPQGSSTVLISFYIMKCDTSFNFVDWTPDNYGGELLPFFDYWSIDILEPTSTYNQGYNDGYDIGVRDGDLSGYNRGYEYGYNVGYNVGSSSSITTNWFTSFLNSVFNILNIEVFPNIKLSYLIFIPIGLGVLALIFKLIRG